VSGALIVAGGLWLRAIERRMQDSSG